MSVRPLAFALLAAALASAGAVAQAAAPATVTTEFKNSTGATVGGVALTEAPKGVLLRLEVKGLSPGWHGLHFHEKGDCSDPAAASAGGAKSVVNIYSGADHTLLRTFSVFPTQPSSALFVAASAR